MYCGHLLWYLKLGYFVVLGTKRFKAVIQIMILFIFGVVDLRLSVFSKFYAPFARYLSNLQNTPFVFCDWIYILET